MEPIKITKELLGKLPAGSVLYTKNGEFLGTIKRFSITDNPNELSEGGIDCGDHGFRYYERFQKLFDLVGDGRVDAYLEKLAWVGTATHQHGAI